MSARHRKLAALAAVTAALAVAGCGSSDEPEVRPLPRATVADLLSRLTEVQNRYDSGVEEGNVGACDDIVSESYPAIDSLLGGLPANVDPDLRSAVEESFSRLRELTREGCSNVEEAAPEPEPEPVLEPEPVPEETVPEETVPEETVPEKPKQEKQPKPEKPPKGEGNGIGNPGGTVAPGGGGQPAPEDGG